MSWARLGTLLLLLFGVECVVAGKPFDNEAGGTEVAFLIMGVILLSLYNAVMWDRSE